MKLEITWDGNEKTNYLKNPLFSTFADGISQRFWPEKSTCPIGPVVKR